ncbi:TasA family protein [Bacillus sp. FJAT-27225]|uniref:TasA family protein n=1 Tax=Bacillus sp. FJAT-27225 TaxID=1743144 RepID=UPI0015869262|nr:TasA family protein [Bacillus sp. FJAT-27225]
MKKLLLTMVWVILLAAYLPMAALADQTEAGKNVKEIDITTVPEEFLVQVENFKPGDWVVRELKVLNSGKMDFYYSFENSFLKGSEKLYNELLLKVTSEKTTLFNGKLKDFKELNPNFLAKGKTEILTMTVEMPFELGNEYQGLGTEFLFKLYATGEEDIVIPPGDKPTGPSKPVGPGGNSLPLPNTATGMFSLLAIGIGLVTAGGYLYILSKKKMMKTGLNRP